MLSSTGADADINHWIGLRRGHIDDCKCLVSNTACDDCRNSYYWIDYTPLVYINWGGVLEPGVGGCLSLGTAGWVDDACEAPLQFFCERGKLINI